MPTATWLQNIDFAARRLLPSDYCPYVDEDTVELLICDVGSTSLLFSDEDTVELLDCDTDTV